jgi:ornithine cyclodeaminase
MITIEASQVEHLIDWGELCDHLAAGHARATAQIKDSVLSRDGDSLLVRSAWIDGLGMAVKVATVFPGNAAHHKATVQGSLTLYHDQTGEPEALVDFDLVTRYKTVGHSLLATTRLANPEPQSILMVGAGRIAAMALAAYQWRFPQARFSIWNHRVGSAEQLAERHPGVQVVTDLEQAVGQADIISCATLSREPLIRGHWLRPGQHLDLIGAFKADMREADDEVMRRARLFVDSRQTTLGHIGEIDLPIAAGVIGPESIRADFYDLPTHRFARQHRDDITVFKNGGGAHLDLMTARYVLACWRAGVLACAAQQKLLLCLLSEGDQTNVATNGFE